MRKEKYLGVNVITFNYEEIIIDIAKRMDEGIKSTIIAVNPEKFIAAGKDEKLKNLMNEATYQIPDGVGVLLASRLKGGNIRSRVTGVDMMDRLLRFAAKENKNIFMYGAKEEVVVQAKKNIEKAYPSIQIRGYSNGYQKDQEALIHQINHSKAEILFVALGSPRQELWIRDNMEKLEVKVFQGVGGSFDVFAGNVKRAPLLFRKLGLEWFYRLITDPKRIKRQIALPVFLYKIIFNKS
jgi:N-acetylglucosaminyldiphosphoundecaprenol N-acetyl-beta-D-mannosaminyltransferase